MFPYMPFFMNFFLNFKMVFVDFAFQFFSLKHHGLLQCFLTWFFFYSVSSHVFFQIISVDFFLILSWLRIQL